MEVEHLAGFGHTFDAADELPHDLRPLRVAEIHAVRRRQGHRAHSCDIAPAFGNRLLAALVRVGIAIARRAIGADRDTLARTLHPYDRSIATGALARSEERRVGKEWFRTVNTGWSAQH